MKKILSFSFLMLVVSVAALAAAPIHGGGGAMEESGFRALSGEAAASFTVPGDMELVRTFSLEDGTTYERYQQYFGNKKAAVFGGQITLYKDASGSITTVIGVHYPNIVPTNAVKKSKADADVIVDQDLGDKGEAKVDYGAAKEDKIDLREKKERKTSLLIDPTAGHYFYQVETQRFDSRWFHWVNADNGKVLNKYNAIETNSGTGTGVKGDLKDLDGADNSNGNGVDDQTTLHGASGHGAAGLHWDLFSKDNRQWTYNARNGIFFLYYATDADNHWTTPGRTSPGQPALIDAQYYANTTDDYFLGRHRFNWQNCYARMRSVAHFGINYNNAFWNGTYTVYGDGDGVVFKELSGALDIVAHEHTHGVTDCTSKLVYQGESGALNESFSDIIGNSVEFFTNEPTTSNCVRAPGQAICADWWIGEDVFLPSDAVVGFRNMADPQEDGDPDHYDERYTGPDDNGGVHTNSGIPNHAYYLLVNGGQNRGCDTVGSNGHTHTANCNVSVTAISRGNAERIFFQGFTGLPSNATMCQARIATVARAEALLGIGSQEAQSTRAAWEAVGLTAARCRT